MKRGLLAGALLLSACTSIPKPPQIFAPDRVPKDAGAFFDCLRERSLTVVSAHRGGDLPAENGVPTFSRTVNGAPGPVLLEVDVRRTRDGALVLLHDETLDRTTNGSGPVSAIDVAQFKKLKLKDIGGELLRESPPTLDDALDWARERAVLKLDVKARGDAALYRDTIAAVRRARAQERVVVIVGSPQQAALVHKLAPELMMSVPIDLLSDLNDLEAAGVDLDRVLAWTGTRNADPSLNAALAREGVEVIFGTLGASEDSLDARFAADGDEGYAALADTGVHVIATRRPLEAMREIDDEDGPGAPARECLKAD
jgi:glycerophosphoryl diester phosphodiesterase